MTLGWENQDQVYFKEEERLPYCHLGKSRMKTRRFGLGMVQIGRQSRRSW